MGSYETYESSDDEEYDESQSPVFAANSVELLDPLSKAKRTNFFSSVFARNSMHISSSISKDFRRNDSTNNLSPQFTDAVSLFLDHIICHPFTMFKMQCQVNSLGRWVHVTPFTVIPFLYQQFSSQGMGAAWKGLRSSLIFHGSTRLCETMISGATNYPLESKSVHSFKQLVQHLCLKAASFAIMTPFYTTFVMETVQSYSASETPGIIDGIAESLKRFFQFRPSGHRVLFLWQLIIPMSFCGLLHYVTYKFVNGAALIYIRHRIEAEKCYNKENNLPEPYKPEIEAVYPQILSSIIANFAAVALVFPFQTAMNRLCIQGTRCIIDSTDIPGEVLPINTQYKSFLHCLSTISKEEGSIGFYRGFGSLVLHYALQLTGVWFLQSSIDRALDLSKQL